MFASHSGNQWVTCFQESAEALLGTTADYLGQMRESVSCVNFIRSSKNLRLGLKHADWLIPSLFSGSANHLESELIKSAITLAESCGVFH